MDFEILNGDELVIKKGEDGAETVIPKTAFHEVDKRRNGDLEYYADPRFKDIVKMVIKSPIKTIEPEAFTLSFPKLEEVSLPEGLEEIDEGVFKGAKKLWKVHFPSTIKRIKARAFEGCTSLNRLFIPTELETIDETAFEGCTALSKVFFTDGRTGDFDKSLCFDVSEVKLPEGITSLPDRGFFDHRKLQKIIIPSTITDLGEATFEGCDKLQEVVIPTGVTKIPRDLFAGCSALKTVIIPEGVEEIQQGAFYGCKSIEEIVLPSTLKKIPTGLTTLDIFELGVDPEKRGTFQGCTSLKRIVIPEGVEEIDAYTFLDCTSLEEIVLPSTIKKIHPGAFRGCKNLKKINLPNGLTEIGTMAFNGCQALEEITIPDTVRELGRGCFLNCSGLKTATLSAGLTTIGKNCFCGCKSLEEITIPDEVTTIPEGAFIECLKLRKVTFGAKVKEIESDAFKNCESLEEAIIPKDVTIINKGVFQGCKGLKRVVLPDGIKELAENSFSGCTSLDEINFPDSLDKEFNSFVGCPEKIIRKIPLKFKCNDEGVMTEFTKEDVCNGVLIVPYGVKTLQSLTYKKSEFDIDSVPDVKEIDLPDDLISIEEGVIQDFPKLEKVIMPDSVTKLGALNFKNCPSLKQVRLSRFLTSVPSSIVDGLEKSMVSCIILPESGRFVPDRTVQFLPVDDEFKREKISYTGSVYHNGLYHECTNDNGDSLIQISVTPSETIKVFSLQKKGARDTRNDSFNSLTTKSDEIITMGTYGNLDEITELTVRIRDGKVIAPFALSQCPNLEKVTIEDGIEEIGPGAFAECSKLRTIIIPDSVRRIGEFAFYGCESLESIEINGQEISEIGEMAFAGCSSLETVKLPKRVADIRYGAFKDCTSLKSVDGVDDVERIWEKAFYNCGKLHVRIPKRIRKIGAYAFYKAGKALQMDRIERGETVVDMPVELPIPMCYLDQFAFADSGITSLSLQEEIHISSIPTGLCEDCDFLSEVKLPEGIERIEQSAFKGCSTLMEIDIPTSTDKVEDYAFAYCDHLRLVNFYNPNKREALFTDKTFIGTPESLKKKYAYNKELQPRKPAKKGFSLSDVKNAIRGLFIK